MFCDPAAKALPVEIGFPICLRSLLEFSLLTRALCAKFKVLRKLPHLPV